MGQLAYRQKSCPNMALTDTNIRFHLVDGVKEQIAPELAEDLIDLVRAYLK
jgi:hypothetical protein